MQRPKYLILDDHCTQQAHNKEQLYMWTSPKAKILSNWTRVTTSEACLGCGRTGKLCSDYVTRSSNHLLRSLKQCFQHLVESRQQRAVFWAEGDPAQYKCDVPDKVQGSAKPSRGCKSGTPLPPCEILVRKSHPAVKAWSRQPLLFLSFITTIMRKSQSFWFSDLFYSDSFHVMLLMRILLQNKSGFNIVLAWRQGKAKLSMETFDRAVKGNKQVTKLQSINVNVSRHTNFSYSVVIGISRWLALIIDIRIVQSTDFHCSLFPCLVSTSLLFLPCFLMSLHKIKQVSSC